MPGFKKNVTIFETPLLRYFRSGAGPGLSSVGVEVGALDQIGGFLDVETSGEVYLEQNSTRNLILRSVWP